MKYIRLAAAITSIMIALATPAIASGKLYKGMTIVFYASKHGIQVEHYSNSGRTYLWISGKRKIYRGLWKAENQNQICVHYGSTRYNPATRKRSKKWLCQKSNRYPSQAKYACRGDVFRLSSGKVPYVLKKSKSGIEKLKPKCSGRT